MMVARLCLVDKIIKNFWSDGIGLPIYIDGPMAHLRDIRLQNLNNLELGISRSSKVKREGVIGLSKSFLFKFNIGPNSALLRDIRL